MKRQYQHPLVPVGGGVSVKVYRPDGRDTGVQNGTTRRRGAEAQSGLALTGY
jgi:hypothetical protein